uniref:Uncharacterized protein n=1 Tax=Meloidogyne javanica TaxID=6303 RepID=A0A915LUI2_MELJA
MNVRGNGTVNGYGYEYFDCVFVDQLYACPKCEAWCANDPLYMCNYTCQDIHHLNLDKKEVEFHLGLTQKRADERNKKSGRNENCTNDFKSYDDDMEEDDECNDGKFYGIQNLPRENPKYWTMYRMVWGIGEKRYLMNPWKPCNM